MVNGNTSASISKYELMGPSKFANLAVLVVDVKSSVEEGQDILQHISDIKGNDVVGILILDKTKPFKRKCLKDTFNIFREMQLDAGLKRGRHCRNCGQKTQVHKWNHARPHGMLSKSSAF